MAQTDLSEAGLKHFNLGMNLGGVENIVSVSEDGSLFTRDVQRATINAEILDQCQTARDEFDLSGPDRTAYGYLAARIPITLWQNWRREWQEKYRQYWTWQTFEVMKLNSRDFCGFRTVNHKIAVPEHVRTTGA